MRKILALALVLGIWSVNGYAGQIAYRADIKGMVCAFCAYNVSKSISALEGVDADSVDIDLKNGRATFVASKPITQAQLGSVITKAGYNLVKLTELKAGPKESTRKTTVPAVDMNLNGLEPAQFQPLMEAFGDLAASQRQSRIVLDAPKSLEDALLKSLLLGRKQAMKLQFVPSATKTIRLRLFMAPTD